MAFLRKTYRIFKTCPRRIFKFGFNPVSVSPYKSKLSVRADGNVEVGTAKISLEGSDEIMVETMAVRESLNRQIAKKTASAEFIDDWVSEQIRVFKIENPNASDADLDNFIEEQVKVLSENKVLDSETVKLFLPGKYETQRVFNQGVYKKLSEVFGKNDSIFVNKNVLDGEQ